MENIGIGILSVDPFSYYFFVYKVFTHQIFHYFFKLDLISST